MVANTDLISAAEYNYSRDIINTVLSSYGYTPTSVSVIANVTIVSSQATAYQWTALYADMNKCAGHQGTTISLPTLSNIASGSLVYATDISKFRVAADLLYTNRYNIAESSIETLATPSVVYTYPSSWWGAGNSSIQHNFRMEFTNETAANAFFNAGGKILWNASRTDAGSAGYTLQNANWTTLLTNLGTMTYAAGGTTYGGGAGAFGYYATPTSSSTQLLAQQGTDTSSSGRGTFYADNDCTIYVYKNTTGTAPFNIYFNIIFRDDDKQNAIGTNPYGNYDYVDGNMIALVRTIRPSGANIDIARPNYYATKELVV